MSAEDEAARARALVAARGLPLGEPLAWLAETTSTNDEAKAGARAGAPHGAVWVAEVQSAGRGRQGRSWFGAPGESLMFSVLLRTNAEPRRVPPLALACGLAVRDAVSRALGEAAGSPSRARVKWPNDVLVDGRKIAGILVESAVQGARVDHVIVGCGINVHTRDLPAELSEVATSLAIAAEEGRPLSRAEILADVLAALSRDADLVLHKGLAHLAARLAEHDALFGREVEGDAIGRGTAQGIDADGRLRVALSDGTLRAVSAGEVRVVG